jgi:lipopolysaccharide assembly outer membrane protein LptD (OstA)
VKFLRRTFQPEADQTMSERTPTTHPLQLKTIAVLLFFPSLFISTHCYAQTPDSLSAIPKDSLTSAQSDSSANVDTTAKKRSGIDTVVNYSANDSIVYSYKERVMKMYGDGSVKYRTMGLTSERIDVNWNDNTLESFGVLDTTKAANADSIAKSYRGSPVMIDGGETYYGWKVGYNFKTQKGRITLGNTEMEQGYYHGQYIKKIDKDMLFVANGRYTTCDRPDPDYYFYSPKMRVTIRDKIVAEPIYLYVADVPVFVLPFGVFPSQGGRRSGIIAPAYGEDARRGKFFSHLGYYAAISDYTDLSLAGDWYTEGGWKGYSQFRYAKRYEFDGGVSGEYSRVLIGEPRDADRQDEANYRTHIWHEQKFNPTTNMNVDFTFTSNNSYKTSNNYQDYLQQDIYSNATLNKLWEGTNNSMSINVSRHQNLLNGNIEATLPTISFSHSQSYPFRSEKRSRGLSGSSGNNYAWYELIGVGYSGQLINRNNKTLNTLTNNFVRYDRSGISHSFNINAAPKAGYFTISPLFSYNENWYDKSTRIVGVDTNNVPIKKDVNGFEAVRYFSTGLSAGTKLYGIFQPPIPGLVGIRHTVTPSLSYSYRPDFSKRSFGYYGTYIDTSGKVVKYDRFQNEVYGGAPAGEQQALNLRVENLFEMKTETSDSLHKENKYQLLNLNASVGYNFAADSMRLSNLFLSYRTNIGSVLNINGSSAYSFYRFDPSVGHRVGQFLFEANKGFVQLTNISLSLSTSLSGGKVKRAETTPEEDSVARAEIEQYKENRKSGYQEMYEEAPPDFSIPWNLSLNFNFTQSQDNPAQKFRSANISANLGFNLTENWKFSASGSYDLIQRQFAAPRIVIYRDLHCWEMNFSWSPLGQLAGYRLELKVKAPQLQDLKITKQSQASGYY